ncbi:uncharacterized protein EDB93DRAFT_879886 [Suillus bovinus]|uniref:uncharacterized protein n=1 Tax=Suillus bovinus TaxID=48563 RepID=UPI001B8822EF|nr:uncharacterized protein EDB93DRAFT_879886 [Suillus bovinus]KAG2133606.1 hypothetical protein EDB93DRAFT_879886 [Suillus bovinus]
MRQHRPSTWPIYSSQLVLTQIGRLPPYRCSCQLLELPVGTHSPSYSQPAPGESFFNGLPRNWEVPTSPSISKYIFKICCFIFTWRGDLKWLHDLLKDGNNWEELHQQYLAQLNQVSTVQGLVLATAAVFISSNPPLARDVNYTSDASYACLAESLVFSLFGLLFCLKVSASGMLFQKRSAAEIIIQRRWRIFWHLLSLAVPIIIFVISVILLLIGRQFTS